MDDLISRQAAIDALGEKPLAWTDGEYELALQQQWESDIDAIKAVPSAQPTQNERVNSNNPLDCISREAAVHVLCEENINRPLDSDRWLISDIYKKIVELPTVDVVEVVRCRDCKFFVSNMEWCEADDEYPTSPDAFCSWAERRSDE